MVVVEERCGRSDVARKKGTGWDLRWESGVKQ